MYFALKRYSFSEQNTPYCNKETCGYFMLPVVQEAGWGVVAYWTHLLQRRCASLHARLSFSMYFILKCHSISEQNTPYCDKETCGYFMLHVAQAALTN